MNNIGLKGRRRLVLVIDADAHARAVLRIALEAAQFSVGEAVDAAEGERTCMRVRPDAILVDLMLDSVEAGSLLAEKMKANGSAIPVYIVSAAADALVGAVGLRQLGISGVFLKPADTAIVVQTLKTRLAAAAVAMTA